MWNIIKSNIGLALFIGVEGIIGGFLLYRDVNIGMAFVVKTFFVYTFIVVLTLIVSIKKSNEVVGIKMYTVAILLLFLLTPTIKFYMDIPQFIKHEYSQHTGIIESSSNSGLAVIVNTKDKEFSFYLPATTGDFPIGKQMIIYYLPLSMQGIDYELVKE